MRENIPPAEVILDASATQQLGSDAPHPTPDPHRKTLRSVGNHPLKQLWEGGEERDVQFRKLIVDAVKSEPPLDWSGITVHRFGYPPDDPCYDDVGPEERLRPVLWVSIRVATIEIEYLQETLELIGSGYANRKARKSILEEIEVEKTRVEANKEARAARIEEAKKQCRTILDEWGLKDVGVEIHEARVWGSFEAVHKGERARRRAAQGKKY